MINGEFFHEDIYDAVSSTVEALGGFKKVAAWLFPNKPLNTAYAHLKHCLRDDKQEKLDPHELIMIMQKGRDNGIHYIINYMAEAGQYEQPEPCKPEDEMVKLQKEYVEAAKMMARISEKIERVQLTVVK